MRALPRVVMTGCGVLLPIGCGSGLTVYQRLMEGHVGLLHLSDPLVSQSLACDVHTSLASLALTSQVVAPVQLHSQQPQRPSSSLKTSRFIEFALEASSLALCDAGLDTSVWTDEQRERAGVCLGTGLGGVDEIAHNTLLLQEKGTRSLSAYAIPRLLLNLAAGQVSIQFGLRGPQHCASTACATGAHAIGDAMRFLQWGDADIMIAGSSEAPINALSMALFSRMRALSTKHNHEPQSASRPFARTRDGFVMGEGAGVMVLETLDHARKRGARIYAELCGYGCSADAYHITTPSADGRGAIMSMQRAFQNSGLNSLQDIDYINAHATSTPVGDAIENLAIKKLFQSHAYNLSVSSSKGAIGHLLGASGSVEGIFAALACYDQSVPPTSSVREEDVDRSEFDLDYVFQVGKQRRVNASMSNSFGFGGTNASLVFKKIEPS